MKKYFLSIIIAASVLAPTASAFAMEPGYGGDIDCTVWREGMSKDQTGLCFKDSDVTNRRLYELEQAVDRLQSQRSAPNSGSASNASGVTASQFNALERRVSAIESTFDALSKTLTQISTWLATIAARV